jgi:hypothetical protein
MAGFWWLLFGVDGRGEKASDVVCPTKPGGLRFGVFNSLLGGPWLRLFAIQENSRMHSWVVRGHRFLVSLDAVELLDGLSHTMATSRARWRLSGLVRRSLKACCYCIVG